MTNGYWENRVAKCLGRKVVSHKEHQRSHYSMSLAIYLNRDGRVITNVCPVSIRQRISMHEGVDFIYVNNLFEMYEVI